MSPCKRTCRATAIGFTDSSTIAPSRRGEIAQPTWLAAAQPCRTYRGKFMLRMGLKRLLMAVPSLVGVVIVTFLLTRALPGDPAAYFAGPAATKEAIEQIRVNLGLDKPLIVQFGNYVNDLAHGDRGNSPTTGQPVGKEIKSRLPASAE